MPGEIPQVSVHRTQERVMHNGFFVKPNSSAGAAHIVGRGERE
jgi:hypothetical protein